MQGFQAVSFGNLFIRVAQPQGMRRRRRLNRAARPRTVPCKNDRLSGLQDSRREMTMSTSKQAKVDDVGPMPVWNLADLYPGPASLEVEADLRKAARDAKAIKDLYQGKLAAAAKNGARLAEAISAYEALSDIIGKLGSYAGL